MEKGQTRPLSKALTIFRNHAIDCKTLYSYKISLTIAKVTLVPASNPHSHASMYANTHRFTITRACTQACSQTHTSTHTCTHSHKGTRTCTSTHTHSFTPAHQTCWGWQPRCWLHAARWAWGHRCKKSADHAQCLEGWPHHSAGLAICGYPCIRERKNAHIYIVNC